jgi:hypothetical protein
MKKLFCVTMLTAVTLTMTTAGAKPGDPPLKRERAKYLNLYFAVKHKEGKRAPGRQILRQGVRHGKHVRPATAKEVARSIRQLRILLNPMLVARPPAQAPAAVQTAAAGGTLSAIAACESGGDPHAISPTGAYRGKYQFDYGTWASVGGHGDPAAASEAEQDMRAAMLYRERGSAPWPVCGR